MTDPIRTTCREFFGVYRAGRQVVANRCGACPIAQPCKTWGAAPVRTFEELEAGRMRFVAAATAILEAA